MFFLVCYISASVCCHSADILHFKIQIDGGEIITCQTRGIWFDQNIRKQEKYTIMFFKFFEKTRFLIRISHFSTVPSWFYQFYDDYPLYVFYITRCLLALICAGCETYFYIGVSKEIGANVGRITLGMFLSKNS